MWFTRKALTKTGLLAWLILAALMPSIALAEGDAAADAGTETQQPMLDAGQLDQLVAPIALYPDSLLAQVLMASTYPLEIVEADRFAKANKTLKGDGLADALAKKDWDDSIKSLVSTPTVLTMMSDQLDWTQALGNAVLAQQADVMDAIQRLRAKAQANGKLETTKEQKVTVVQAPAPSAGAPPPPPVIVIEPAAPGTVYVPYYDPAVVYGAWSYPAYPPYYFAPPVGWGLGGALASGIAWGAGFAVANAIWDDFDWHHHDIRVDVDRNVNINRNINRNDVNFSNWQHNSYHRRGVQYNNAAVKDKFANASAKAGDRKLDFRGRTGDQVIKPGSDLKPGGGLKPGGDFKPGGGVKPGGDFKPGGGDRPKIGDLDRKGGGPNGKPDIGKIQQGLKDKKPGQQAAIDRKKPDLGKAAKAHPRDNAFDLKDGPKAKDFAKRGHASLGDRGPKQFKPPSGGGAKAVRRTGGGGGGPARLGGGGGGRPHGGGGHGGRRR